MTNVILGPRYQLRLEDLREWHRLEVRCIVCNHRGLIDPTQIKHRLSIHTRLVDLERRYRCVKCGNRSGNSWRVMQLGRNA